MCLVWIFAPMLGCSSKDVRYPQDHARYQRIDAAVEAFRKAYVRKDLSALQALMLPMESLERVEADVQKDFQSFEEIAMDVAIERIMIEGETVDVYVHWQGQWKRTPEDAGVRGRGHGMLRWVGVQSILLKSVEGDLPFGMSVRHRAPVTQKDGAFR
jgi:hypothetical protein